LNQTLAFSNIFFLEDMNVLQELQEQDEHQNKTLTIFASEFHKKLGEGSP